MYKLLLLAGWTLACLTVEQAAAQVPYVAYYHAPVCMAPAPVVVTSYYAPAPVVAYQPVAVARTRYRPLLGGTVTRYRTGYAPVVIGY